MNMLRRLLRQLRLPISLMLDLVLGEKAIVLPALKESQTQLKKLIKDHFGRSFNQMGKQYGK